jgi:hypothetical protein
MIVPTGFRQRFRDDRLRHVYFALQEIRYHLLGVAGTYCQPGLEAIIPHQQNALSGTLHIPIDQHLVKTRLNDRRYKPAVVSADYLNHSISSRRSQHAGGNPPRCPLSPFCHTFLVRSRTVRHNVFC